MKGIFARVAKSSSKCILKISSSSSTVFEMSFIHDEIDYFKNKQAS